MSHRVIVLEFVVPTVAVQLQRDILAAEARARDPPANCLRQPLHAIYDCINEIRLNLKWGRSANVGVWGLGYSLRVGWPARCIRRRGLFLRKIIF
jgi:hypothetical protein